jgi:hypothetical protein
MTLENPPSVIVRNEITQAAYQNGWRIDDGVEDGWFLRRSASAPGRVAIAGAGPQGPWFLAVDHPGIALELKASAVDLAGPGIARFMISDTKELHAVLGRTWDLAVSLPDHPLRRFETETAGLSRNTEAERLVVQRRGQDVFRDSLLRYWGGCCPLTGITDTQLLRASHMKPWADCETDAERLDPYNGVLLSALWDSAFDAGLISFDEQGELLLSSYLTAAAREALGVAKPIDLRPEHQCYLRWHRERVFAGG